MSTSGSWCSTRHALSCTCCTRERHDKAFEAECVLLETLPQLEAAAGGRVIGSVSVRHDPVEAVEETILGEPVDEILLVLPVSVTRPGTWWHHDLADRLRRFGVPVTTLARDDDGSSRR